jgi:hypothetical protein
MHTYVYTQYVTGNLYCIDQRCIVYIEKLSSATQIIIIFIVIPKIRILIIYIIYIYIL